MDILLMLPEALLACAMGVAPITMSAIVQVESGGNPYALHVNHLTGPQPKATSLAQAAEIARSYMAKGYTVDLGYIQLNNRNAVGYTIEQALEPCTNLQLGARILSFFYAEAVRLYGPGQFALQSALSGYNSGSLSAGFYSGYVAKYYMDVGLPTARTVAFVRHAFTTVSYDRPGLDLRLNKF